MNHGEAYRAAALLQSFMGNLRYKPGYEMRLDWFHGETAGLYITHRAEDATGRMPGLQPITHASTIHLAIGLRDDAEAAFVAHVRQAIEILERHEADEWFRYRGKQLHDPHANIDHDYTNPSGGKPSA